MSLYLLFDIGNTRLKWAAVESDQNPIDRNKKVWLYSGAIDTKLLASPEHSAELAHYILQTIPEPDAIGICCVATEECVTTLQSLFAQWQNVAWLRMRGDTPFDGLRTLYQEPANLGADRWAGLIAARTLSSGNSLVVNSGTASTIDFLSANGMHHGGWIIPGLGLMQSSLESNTARLPVTPAAQQVDGFGLTTAAAITKGCLAAQIGTIHGALQLAKDLHQPIDRIWIDGGNAKHIEAELKQSPLARGIFTESIHGLVLRGLWSWIRKQREHH
jgi:type III pantothenate kinase